MLADAYRTVATTGMRPIRIVEAHTALASWCKVVDRLLECPKVAACDGSLTAAPPNGASRNPKTIISRAGPGSLVRESAMGRLYYRDGHGR
jgi:hypothetical protein